MIRLLLFGNPYSSQVEKLVAKIRAEQGKLHVLVNDISESAEHELGKTFWQADLERGFAMFRNAIHTHIIASHGAAPLLIETAKNSGRTGLIVEIGDGDTYTYRGHLFFDLIKTTISDWPLLWRTSCARGMSRPSPSHPVFCAQK